MTNFTSSMAIVNELDREGSSARKQLLSEGWIESSLLKETYCIGKTRREEARIFTREISIGEKYPKYLARKSVASVQQTSSQNNRSSKNVSDIKALETGSKSTVVHADDNIRPQMNLDNINSMQDLISVKAMRSNKDSLVFALDTEFIYSESGKERFILSYQFAFYDPNDDTKIHECVFFPATDKRLSFWRMMSWILTEYNLCESYDFRSTYRWLSTVKSGKKSSLKSPEKAYETSVVETEKDLLLKQFGETGAPFRSKDYGKDGGYILDFSDIEKTDITLICHFGTADLSTFDVPNYEIDILDVLAKCSHLQGGLVSLRPSCEFPKVIQKRHRFYPIRLNIRDTMCFAPAGQKSLKSLGESISVKKIELPYNSISRMDKYFSENPVHYMEYAINDSVICLMYSSELWGINKAMPVTTTAGALKFAVSTIKNHFRAKKAEELDLFYRGLQIKKSGKEKNSNTGKRFRDEKRLEAISDDAFLITNAATNAYAGGFNGCLGARYVDIVTHDYDLKNAYPTSMSCITDPDWLSDSLISHTIEKRLLTIKDFNSPYDLMFGDVEFEFPENVLFPCIPINVNGSLIYPRTSKGLTKCYASGPELYLAVKLGAKVMARRVYVVSQKIMPDGTPSRCLSKVCQQLVQDRNLAKAKWGSNSFEQNLLKIGINSIYGKTAQNIKPKKSWNAKLAKMDDIGPSRITSPVHACLTTSGVRAVLIAAMNQLSELGYKCYSATTDGLISDAPLKVLKGLNLYGFKKCFEDARMRLTGSRDMWEEKHTNSSFLNFSTRGNISQDLACKGKNAGVCAHNGFRPSYGLADDDKIDIRSGGALDRYITMSSVGKRNGRVSSTAKHFTGFKELSYHGYDLEKRKDFIPESEIRNLRMDFDMKRKPLESSFEQVFFTVKGVTEKVMIEGVEKEITVPDITDCEWVNFDSVPYYSVIEYEIYKHIYDSMACLRTKADWDKFWLKIHALSSKNNHSKHITNASWSILITCVMGHRLGHWEIPALSDKTKSVEEKVAWINKFNTSGKKFTVSSWKNCRRQDRKDQMIDEIDYKELLERMMTDTTET